MIRASDLAGALPWTLPALTPSARADERFATTSAATSAAAWFDAGELAAQASICGDLGPASRGLSVEQHAGRVLMHLRDAGDRGA